MNNYKRANNLNFIFIWIVLFIVVIILYDPFKFYFLNDDFIHVPKNNGGNYLHGITFRPISDITLYFDYLLYRQNAWGYHLTNLFIHLASTFILFHLARRCLVFFKVDAPYWVPHVAAIFFMVFAFHSESVFWIIGRGGSLVTLFFMIALIIILQQQNTRLQLFIACLFFILGMLTYESIWIFPIICTIVAYFKKSIYNIPINTLLAEISPFWLIFGTSFIVRKLMLNDFIGSPYQYNLLSIHGFLTSIYNYATGFFRSFMFPSQPILFIIGSGIIVVFFLSIIILGFVKRCFTTLDLFLMVSFLLTLSPVALLGVNTHNSESERFLYLPSIFVCLLFALNIAKINNKSLKFIIVIFYIGYNIYFLNQSSTIYKIAGIANKTAINQISKINGIYDIIHVVNLPSQYKGGFMFRLGFAEAINWLCPDVKYKKIIVYSTVEYKRPEIIIQDSILPENIRLFIKRDHIIIHPTKDLLIAWDGNRLYVK